MAGEYSRELSVKVFAGQCRLIELGFRQGGPAGFGLRRHLVDQNRKFKQILRDGEYKSLQTDRVVLAAGPPDEVQIVQRIFSRFTEAGETERQIAEALNAERIWTDQKRPWNSARIRQILTNPKYIGSNVFNRRSYKLKKKRVRNPPEMWILKPSAFDAIVSQQIFDRALQIFDKRHRTHTDEDLLNQLRALLKRAGKLSGFIINQTDGMPSTSVYVSRFGTLPRAYSLIGWNPHHDYTFILANQAIRAQHKPLLERIMQELAANDSIVERDPKTDLLTINAEYTAALVLARCFTTPGGSQRWIVRLDTLLQPDITIAARLCPGNEGVLDYYIIPRIAEIGSSIRLADHNPLSLEVFRFDDLSFFSALARRVPVEEAA